MSKINEHVPVLLDTVLEYLAPKPGESYLDLTAGYGGHAQAVLDATQAEAVLVDRDEQAVDYLKQKFKGPHVEVWHQDFLAATKKLLEEGRQFDLILADLGVSSPHLNTASRGFAFSLSGPLDMRMDQSQTLTAEQLVNSASEAELTDIIWRFGEEKRSRAIASAIVNHRPFSSTDELAAVVATAAGVPRRSKIHPATKTFQALRIAVNDELGQLEKALPVWPKLLKPGGRLAVISFHSLEDRIAKQIFKESAAGGYDSELVALTKRPVQAARDEIVSNPRARSAKLRAVAKINTKRKGLHANSGKK